MESFAEYARRNTLDTVNGFIGTCQRPDIHHSNSTCEPCPYNPYCGCRSRKLNPAEKAVHSANYRESNAKLEVNKNSLMFVGASWLPKSVEAEALFDAFVAETGMAAQKINIDENLHLARERNIGQIPAVILFESTREVRRVAWNITAEDLKKFKPKE